MFLSALDAIRRTAGFRITLMSSGFFVVGTIVLFAFAYILLAASLQIRDHDSIEARLRQLAAQYQATNLTGLRRTLALEAKIRKARPFFLRIAGPQNALVFMEIPDQWPDFELSELEKAPLSASGRFVRLAAKDDDAALELATLKLPDGSILQVGKSTEDRDEVLDLFAWILAGGAILVIVIGVVGGVWLTLRMLRPVHELIAVVRAIDSGALEARVPVHQTGDELNELAQLFNGMLNRIAALILGMRGALDNVAHELRTPVARMRAIAEIALESDQSPQAVREALSDCMEESENLMTLLDALMDISEAEAGTLTLKWEPVSVAALMDDVVNLYGHVAEEEAIVVSTVVRQDIWLTADRSRLRQVMANLLDNAIKFTSTGGRIELAAYRQDCEVVITVEDTGMGMTTGELSRIWDRLYRGEHSARGMGLGLSLVQAIVEAHGGRVEASSTPGEGSTFMVIFPQALEIDHVGPQVGPSSRLTN
jgi:signal transduction histidine kinase